MHMHMHMEHAINTHHNSVKRVAGRGGGYTVDLYKKFALSGRGWGLSAREYGTFFFFPSLY